MNGPRFIYHDSSYEKVHYHYCMVEVVLLPLHQHIQSVFYTQDDVSLLASSIEDDLSPSDVYVDLTTC